MFKKVIFGCMAIVAIFIIFMILPSNISRQDAVEIAVSHIGGGTANPASRDFEQFQRVWSVEIFYNSLVHEVYVNMNTGNILRVEIDSLD